MRSLLLNSLFGITLLAYGSASKGQEVFNLKYPIPENIEFKAVIATDSGYIIGGHVNDPMDSLPKLMLAFFDTLGNLKLTKAYANKQNFYDLPIIGCGYSPAMKRTSDGGFIIAGATSSQGFLMKLNSHLDTLWMKYFQLTTIFPLAFRNCVEVSNGYVLCGYKGIDNTTCQCLVMKTDLNGNYLWHKYYGGQYVEYFSNILPTPDGGLIMAGWSNSFCPAVQPGDAGEWYVVKTDSLGNLQWQKHFGNPEIDDGTVMDMKMTQDSCFVLAGRYATAYYNQWEFNTRCWVIKINLQGEILWEKKYDIENQVAYFKGILENSDGTLVCFGQIEVVPEYLYKLSLEGNVIWKRPIVMYNDPDCHQNLYDFDRTPDGGYVLVGFGLGVDANQTQEGWMVKTDAMGYDGTNYQDTSLQMHVTPASITITLGQPVTVHTFIDQGNTPVTVSYSPEVSHYPVYLSLPEATDSLKFYPMQDTTLQITVTNAFGSLATASVQVHVIAGTEEANLKNGFSVLPNPASDYFVIRVSDLISWPCNIEIIGIDGQIVAKYPEIQANQTISTNDFKAGIYFVRVGLQVEKVVICRWPCQWGG